MNEETNPFREWLDARGISASQAAQLIGVELQTIRNWRSMGVPERRRLHVEAVMAAHEKFPSENARMLVEIKIRPSLPQLQAWHNAAQAEGKDLEQWSIDGLDELAAEAENLPRAASPAPVASQPAPAKGAGAA